MTFPDSGVRQRLHTVPLTFSQASAFVENYHRHNKPPIGSKFAIGVATEDGEVHGVAIVGRPIARMFDDKETAEVLRTCTDGTKNANSHLYGACWRIVREMGYRRLITYTQGEEKGTSLVAAGWVKIAERAPRKNWHDSTSPEVRATCRGGSARDPLLAGGIQRAVGSEG